MAQRREAETDELEEDLEAQSPNFILQLGKETAEPSPESDTTHFSATEIRAAMHEGNISREVRQHIDDLECIDVPLLYTLPLKEMVQEADEDRFLAKVFSHYWKSEDLEPLLRPEAEEGLQKAIDFLSRDRKWDLMRILRDVFQIQVAKNATPVSLKSELEQKYRVLQNYYNPQGELKGNNFPSWAYSYERDLRKQGRPTTQKSIQTLAHEAGLQAQQKAVRICWGFQDALDRVTRIAVQLLDSPSS
ncbi:MAG: hypothetical protein Q8O95_01820 [bacterium]|nr:hypothetical protein [bacterium]